MASPKRAIEAMRVAGYHGDRKTWTRLYVESRVGLQRANDAWRSGVAAKERGIPCRCFECSEIGRAHQQRVIDEARNA